MPIENIQNPSRPERNKSQAMLRGARLRCPNCGRGKLFSSYLKVVDYCSVCDEALKHHRADDGPAFFTIMIVGHVIVPLIVLSERFLELSLLVHTMLWFPLTIVLTLLILPIVKGSLVGLQWALRMHGFDPDYVDELDIQIGAAQNRSDFET